MAIGFAGYMAMASAMASMYAQQQAASAQKKAAEAQNQAIQDETLRQYGELSDEENEITRDAHQQSIQAQTDYMKAKSAIELQSAATGTYGQSVDLAIEDLNTSQGQRQTDILRDRESNLERVNQTARNIQAQSNANMNRSPIKKPSVLEAGIAAGQAYNIGASMDGALRDSSKVGAGGAMRPDAVK